MTEEEVEAAQAKALLGIGSTLEERMGRVIGNQYQYASAGDIKMFIREILRLRNVVTKVYQMANQPEVIKITREALDEN